MKERLISFALFILPPVIMVLLVLGVYFSEHLDEMKPFWTSNALDYINQNGKLWGNGPEAVSEKDWNKVLYNVPKESRGEVIEKMWQLYQSTYAFSQNRFELMETVYQMSDVPEQERYVNQNFSSPWTAHLLFVVEGLTIYPATHDPKRKSEYWKQSTKDAIYWIETRTKMYDELLEKEKLEHTRLQALDETASEEEKIPRTIKPLSFLPHLTQEQKDRLRNGLPIFDNPYLSRPLWENYLASWRNRHNPAQAYMFELRDEELAANRVNETPELDALQLTVDDLLRWDGSTSLKPLAKIIAAHAADLPWAWEGGFSSPLGFAEEMKYDAYAIEKTPNTVYLDRDRLMEYRLEIPSNHPIIWKTSEENAYIAFLDTWQFSKTHSAIVNVIERKRDLALVSRKLSPDEQKLAKEKNVELEFYPFAKDALVFLKNRNNPHENLTLEQVRKIFSGKITTWKKLDKYGGHILPLVRNRNSGSEELMREMVMKNVEIKPDMRNQISPSMEGIFDFLEIYNMGIGYTIHYFDRYMVCSPYTRAFKLNGIEATPQTIADGSYSLIYECVAVVRKDGPERAKNIARWLSGPEGAKIVKESGYVPK